MFSQLLHNFGKYIDKTRMDVTRSRQFVVQKQPHEMYGTGKDIVLQQKSDDVAISQYCVFPLLIEVVLTVFKVILCWLTEIVVGILISSMRYKI